jgi:hypothetical protein
MSVRMAGPVGFIGVEVLEERRLLAGVAEAVEWDLNSPIQGELSARGEVDYIRFEAQAGEQFVFNSTGMKRVAILDSDGTTELNQVLILDGVVPQPPGRLVWEAPHAGTFYVSVSGYTAFLIDSPTGPYSLAAYEVDESQRPEDGPLIAARQEIHGDFSSAGDIDYYSFDAKAGTIYRFELFWVAPPNGSGLTDHHVIGVLEALPWNPQPQQPDDAEEAYPGHNIRFTNLDGQKALGRFAEWVAPASGRYHLSVAPLDEANLRLLYTLDMRQRAFPCDPQSESASTGIGAPLPMPPSTQISSEERITSRNTQSKSSSHSRRHQKPRKHHRRPAVDRHERPAATENLHSARRKLLSLARD